MVCWLRFLFFLLVLADCNCCVSQFQSAPLASFCKRLPQKYKRETILLKSLSERVTESVVFLEKVCCSSSFDSLHLSYLYEKPRVQAAGVNESKVSAKAVNYFTNFVRRAKSKNQTPQAFIGDHRFIFQVSRYHLLFYQNPSSHYVLPDLH
jgi:hypothetical protein